MSNNQYHFRVQVYKLSEYALERNRWLVHTPWMWRCDYANESMWGEYKTWREAFDKGMEHAAWCDGYGQRTGNGH